MKTAHGVVELSDVVKPGIAERFADYNSNYWRGCGCAGHRYYPADYHRPVGAIYATQVVTVPKGGVDTGDRVGGAVTRQPRSALTARGGCAHGCERHGAGQGRG